ncbi:BTAD domain-containing putative transcriptional regulator [Nonomuraea sp. B1E8]|uniref:BTAD domain-containing putative transcriptional regulator n=1 Tax=unclassified Nonomuraea TaxID=2593643 RepID=UPI00325EF086
MVRFRLFGAVEAQVGDARIDLGTERERRLLAGLLAAKGRAVQRQKLLDWIWDDVPDCASGDLDKFMTRLRSRLDGIGLGQALVSKDRLCRLDVPADAVDVHRFRALVAQARDADDQRAADLLGEALELSDGEPLADLRGEVIDGYRHALNEERYAAELAFVQLELRRGHHHERMADVARLFLERPEDTTVAGLHMYALHLAGRQAEALRVHDEHRRRLKAIGLDVPRPLAELHERILRNDERLRPVAGQWPVRPAHHAGPPLPAAVLPVRATELEAARDSPDPADEAGRILAEQHLAVLVGDPVEARTAALRLLGDRSRGDGFTVLDVTQHWDRPSGALLPPPRDACGYLLTLNDTATDRPDVAFAEDLLTHAGRLADSGSYLVVTVRPELWRDCWPAANAVTVRLTRPVPAPPVPPDREHLRLTDPDGRVSLYPLRDGRTPRARVSLGRAVTDDPPPDIVLASGGPSIVGRRHAWIEHSDGGWWLVRASKNGPLIRRRGTTRTERVEDRSRIKDGDVIIVQVGASADGQLRGWRLEFRDPLETTTSRGDDQ